MDERIAGGDGISGNSTSSEQSATLLPYNLPLISAFLAFAIAQFLKLFTTWFKERKWDSKRMIDSGGMPSSHSATVTALAVSIGLQDGTGAPEFAIAVVLACIVMYDASGIRHHAGRQAELLNQIVCEFPPEHPLSSVRPLRELLGHTPLQEGTVTTHIGQGDRTAQLNPFFMGNLETYTHMYVYIANGIFFFIK
ncbi:hypothetical protein SAY86_018756 [Trapa natans]|uniref:Acid phosphatase/vanadium-dependent haloperoxidase-related protein n=1 Tax=Trapa natans TaxID=22666 RepID=A0AAN7LJR6_TRANT|nr:hypothetical protein SAY86_018756 [Trapa natans]